MFAVVVLKTGFTVFTCLGLLDSGLRWAVSYPVVAVAYGVVIGVGVRRARQQVMALAPATLTAAQRDEARETSRRGPVPVDLAVRREARRLAEWRSSAVGRSAAWSGSCLGLLVIVLAVAGWLTSRWWWASAGVLAVLLIRLTRQRRADARQLQLLRQETSDVTLIPEMDGPHRVDNDDLAGLLAARPTRGVLKLEIRYPFLGGSSYGLSPQVMIDGLPVPSQWGGNTYLLPPGPYRVDAAIRWIGDFGPAQVRIVVQTGQAAVLHYSPPALRFLDGRLGPERQARPGALGLGIFLAVAVVGLGLAILLEP